MISDTISTVCKVRDCDSNHCDGSNCEKCDTDYYLFTAFTSECRPCNLKCMVCDEIDCLMCLDSSCPSRICKHANCTTSWCKGSKQCTSCPDGFYKAFDKHCLPCANTNCKCDELNPCIDCLSGMYGVSDLCVNDCPSTCVTCTNSTLCTSCRIGYYGPACQYDSYSDTDNVTDDDDDSGRGKNNGRSISGSYTRVFFGLAFVYLGATWLSMNYH